MRRSFLVFAISFGLYFPQCLSPAAQTSPPGALLEGAGLAAKFPQDKDIERQADGELALWLDGKLTAHFAKGAHRKDWTGLGFSLTDQGGEPFEGFHWRTNNELKINFFWLLHYVTENAARQNNVKNPKATNRVWFDQIVAATDYIGPIASKGGKDE